MLNLLLKYNITIKDAENTLAILGVGIDQTFNQLKLKTKVGELGMEGVEEKGKAQELIELLKDLTITEATQLLFGLEDQIKISLDKENKERQLSTVKVEML